MTKAVPCVRIKRKESARGKFWRLEGEVRSMNERKMKVAIVEDDAAFAALLEKYIETFEAAGGVRFRLKNSKRD